MAHHLGAMVPFFDERIETGWATLGSRTSGEDYSHVLPSLGKPLLDCFKDFYGDTALCGGASDWSAGSISTASITSCMRPTLRSARRACAIIHPLADGGGRLARHSAGGQEKDLLRQRGFRSSDTDVLSQRDKRE